MSNTAVSDTVAKPAPWKATFVEHLSKMASPTFNLASLHGDVPASRTCISRGMWAELAVDKRNEAPLNESVYESDLPTFTTDVRMLKVRELFASSDGHADREELAQGSGGGGPVEAVWWVESTRTQWRIKGHAFVVGNDIEGSGDESSGVRTVKSEVGKRMRVVKQGQEDKWSWQTELTAQFGNLAPGMRGTFKNPPPGLPKSEPYDKKAYQPATKVNDLHEPAARKNFRVVIICPSEVEQLDISTPETSRRYVYTFNSSTNAWDTVETWP